MAVNPQQRMIGGIEKLLKATKTGVQAIQKIRKMNEMNKITPFLYLSSREFESLFKNRIARQIFNTKFQKMLQVALIFENPIFIF